ncbi:hypothetical protein Daes_0858 [Pseudodesulfovibrio aespoeensis Aspo-2]|uniref:Uncharacterized protein n=1 Tax=Pseudodesulfovibrio aespoeensis (strain ATCC 700646 / DSM 10631 / Aspo-2) TaxID=643562 RepID=E6VRE6_PSEA9|nr:hypothetical protein Daes_0858 [Pseudodesulfovibrio aespoeensis Aspo-2]
MLRLSPLLAPTLLNSIQGSQESGEAAPAVSDRRVTPRAPDLRDNACPPVLNL